MIVIFDIGNTNITIGFFKDNKILNISRIETNLINDFTTFSLKLKSTLTKYNIKDVFVGSVVPKATKIIFKIIKKFFNINPKYINKNTRLNIINKYKNKKQVGDDRLANAVAAAYYYKKKNVIVIDFGTAITFDVINHKSEYLGGLILPGINLSLRCLAFNTAKLPKVKIKNIESTIGNTTERSIISGIKNGFTGAIKYILEKIKKELKLKKPKIILTGGEADLIKTNFPANYIIDKNFTLKGFKIIYDINQKEINN
jgi:type III pantothenate kinase